MIQSINESVLLCQEWEQMSCTKAYACIKPTVLPTTITSLQNFACQFKLNTDGGDCWCRFALAFLSSQAASCKWMAKRNRLCILTEHLSWLNYFPQETDLDFWATTINHWIEANFPSSKLPRQFGWHTKQFTMI